MKKILLILALIVGTSASAQMYSGLQYQANFFGGGGYLMDGVYVNHTQFKSMLLEDQAAYRQWESGTSNLKTGAILLYPSAAILGWGIGTNLGNSIVDDYGYDSGSSGTAFIVVGGAGLIGAYYLLAKGQREREQALFSYNKGKSKVGWKPITNENGGGIRITF